MKWLGLAALLVLVAVLILVAGLLIAPAGLLLPVANHFLVDFETEIGGSRGLAIAADGLFADRLVIATPALSVELNGLIVEYTVGGLLDGRAERVAVDRMVLQLHEPAADAAQSDEPDWEALLDAVAGIPLESLRVRQIDLPWPFSVSDLALQTDGPRLSLLGRAAELEFLLLELNLQRTDSSRLTGSGRVLNEGEAILSAGFEAELAANDIALELSAEAQSQAVQSLPQFAGFGDIRFQDPTLFIIADAALTYGDGRPTLSSLRFSLDTADAALGTEFATGDDTLVAQLQMPLDVVVEPGPSPTDLRLNTAALSLTLEADQALASGTARFNASDVSVVCAQSFDCQLEASMALLLQQWQTASLSGSDSGLRGDLIMDWSQGLPSLRAPELQLSLPSLSHAGGAASGSARIEDLRLELPESGPELSFGVVSTDLNPGLEGLRLRRPRLDMDFSLAAAQLITQANLTLNNRLGLTVDLRHALGSDTLQTDLSLAPVTFTESSPLSSLISQDSVDLDLVSGTLSAASELEWRAAETGWLATGPVRITAEQIGGLFGQIVFLGLDTELDALVEENQIRSEELNAATLATMDFGMPLGPIEWQYGFDSAERSLTVMNLITQVFGGTVEVARFVYDLDSESNLLEIVVAGLDLQAIVALAEYPNVQVEGEISGYIPVQILADDVLVNEGLISALSPGGSIRYTPTTGGGNSPSVQLINDALSNYQFDTLNAEVDYEENGDLVMAVELRGNNPEIGAQPINLNISITDNIPSLLRSLQAASRISDRLQEQLERR